MNQKHLSRIILCLSASLMLCSLSAEAYPKRRVIEIKRADGTYQEAILTRHASRLLHRSAKDSKTPAVIFGRYIRAGKTVSVRFRVPLPEADRNAPAIRRRDIWNHYSVPVDSTIPNTNKNSHETETNI